MLIGTFDYDRRRDTYTGDITTLVLQRAKVTFRPVDKNGDKEPDYRITDESGGTTAELGAAWKRRSRAGEDYLSVVLDDPSLPAPLNAALIFDGDTGKATLIWSRPVTRAPDSRPSRSPR